jgi:hypothetical protein
MIIFDMLRNILFIIVIFLAIHFKVNSQKITTFAGGGTGGDGGMATAAQLITPWDATFDKNGNYYVAEGGASKIRKVSTTGLISTITGTGIPGYNGDNIAATLAQLKNAGDVAFDINGNLYITDEGNHRIRKVDAITGIITTIAGTGVGGYNGDDIQATAAQIYHPTSLCFDQFGNLFFSDNANHRVRKIDVSGIITTYAGNGTMGSSGDGGQATNAQFILLSGLAVDNANNLYISDWNGGKVRRVNSLGIISTYAGTGAFTYNGDEISATSANIAPIRIAFNKANELFIVDNPNDRIRKVDNSGIIHTIAGNGLCCYSGDEGPAIDAKIGNPGGIAVDTCDNIYVSQVDNPRIRKIAFNPTCAPADVKIVANLPGNLSLYPNPATTQLTITATQKINSLLLTNALGQPLIHRQYPGTEQVPLDVSHLPPGLYILRINGTHIKRFTKQ